jgi:hypothetical protein
MPIRIFYSWQVELLEEPNERRANQIESNFASWTGTKQIRKRCGRRLGQLKIDLDDLVAESGDLKFTAYPKDALELLEPASVIDWHSLDGKISEDRINALEDGAEPVEAETQLFRRELINERFEEPDADLMPGIYFCSLPKKSDLPPVVVVTCTGYSFGAVDYAIFGAFENEEQAIGAALTVDRMILSTVSVMPIDLL